MRSIFQIMIRGFFLSILAVLAASVTSAQEKITIYFDFDKYVISDGSRKTLDSVLSGTDKISSFTLVGHCDAIGSDAYNLALSINRVNEVRKYLLQQTTALVNVRGLGETSPVRDNNTPENRQWNRRVEILISRSTIQDPPKTLTEKLLDTTLTTGSQVVLPMINFVGGRHQFLPESKPMLDQLLQALRSYPTLEIEIQGHICCQPDDREGLDNETGLYNLSFARAREVYYFLVNNGIGKSRLSYRGFGHSVPLHPYPERTEEEMTANRRVEIRIIKR